MLVKATRARLLVAAVALGLAAAAPAAAPTYALAAESKLDAARAREMFREALALEAAGDYASALERLQQVAAFKNTPQVRFNIGLCQEKLGRLVVALGEYRIALADAEQDPGAKKVVAEAGRAIAQLEPRIPTVSVTRGTGAENAAISIDGKSIGVAMLEKPLRYDPGTHVIEATADGHRAFRKEVVLAAGDKVAVEVTLEKAAGPAAAPVPVPVSQTPEPVASGSASPAPTAAEQSPAQPQAAAGGGRTAGWIVTGLGATSLVVGVVFYARRSSAMSDLDAVCGVDRQSCPASARETFDTAKRDTLVGNVAVGVGVAGLLGGLILLATSGRDDAGQGAPAAARALRVVPAHSSTLAGVTVQAGF